MSALAQFRRGLVYLLLSIAAFVSIFPFYWMIVGSTNRSADVVTVAFSSKSKLMSLLVGSA